MTRQQWERRRLAVNLIVRDRFKAIAPNYRLSSDDWDAIELLHKRVYRCSPVRYAASRIVGYWRNMTGF